MAQRNVYSVNIPALDPLASGVDEHSADAICQGENLDLNHVVAANRQYKNRKHLSNASPPMANEAEVARAKKRRHIVQSANFDGPVPIWAEEMKQ